MNAMSTSAPTILLKRPATRPNAPVRDERAGLPRGWVCPRCDEILSPVAETCPSCTVSAKNRQSLADILEGKDAGWSGGCVAYPAGLFPDMKTAAEIAGDDGKSSAVDYGTKLHEAMEAMEANEKKAAKIFASIAKTNKKSPEAFWSQSEAYSAALSALYG